MLKNLKAYFSLVKFSHTIFAMPFALTGFFMAVFYYNYTFNPITFLYVILCMVFARNAAMGFNRYIDRNIDAKNSRTANREIPAGIINDKAALIFIIINSLAFIVTTYFINILCFSLSPIALIVILGYSVTKRFTALCHFVLGLGLSFAPIGAFIAVTGSFKLLPILLSVIVLLWTGGFDIIYALQDENFDKEEKLFSIPSFFGSKRALVISSFAHFIVIVLVVYLGIFGQFSVLYWIGAILFSGLLIYQHIIVKPNDLSKVNIAFGITNGIAGVIFGVFTISGFLL